MKFTTGAGRHPAAAPFSTMKGIEVLDVVGIPYFVMSGDGEFLGGNTALYRLVGDDRQQDVGRDVYEILIKVENPAQSRVEDREQLAEGGRRRRWAELMSGEGDARLVVITTVVDDEANCLLATIDDRQDLAEIRNNLHVVEAESKAILKGFPGIVCLFDVDERVIWANDRIYQLDTEPVGKTCHELFCRRERACNACAIPKSLEKGQVQTSIQQIEMCTASGEEWVYELTSTPVRDKTGKISSVVVIGRDVTETTSLEKQLRHTQKMEAIGTLAGGIAHDFNNVLTPIMGYAEILRFHMGHSQGKEGDPDGLEFVEGILKAARRAKKLVEQILTFSRSSEDKANLQYLHPIVKEVMKLMRVTLPSTITIREEIDEGCGMVSVDPVQIHQILINLCTNSAHAMAGGHGTLTVALAEADTDQGGKQWLRLRISDTGCGIPEEMQERIFEPYFTTKEKSRGTGMGLAMVHGIVTRQGGRIKVRSEVGKGTTFDIFLPVTAATTRIDQVVSMADLARGTGRILLVDDESQVVQVTGELLTSLGYEVSCYTSPLEALRQVEREPAIFDLLLTDLTMPELTGIELAQKIREIRPTLPVVLFTGYSETVSREAVRNAGIQRYCMKPLSLRELARTIDQVLHETNRM